MEDQSLALDADSPRSSGRSRTPTKRMAESNLSLVFLSRDSHMSADPGTHLSESAFYNRQGGEVTARQSRPGKLKRRGAFESRGEGVSRKAPEREKRKRDGSNGASDEKAPSLRPKRAAAILGEVKREIGLEKLFTRRAGRGSAAKESLSATSSRTRHSREPSRDAARRPASNSTRRRASRLDQEGRARSQVSSGTVPMARGSRGRGLRRMRLLKAGTGSKTRLDLTSLGSSSASSAGTTGRKHSSAAGKGVARGDEEDDVSTGSSSNGCIEQSSHRRDWGLMEVDAVGRNRPPFARTMLYHGTVPFPLPADLSDQTPARNWVIKRWPDKANRRKIDQEVHECIKNHPHPYLVRIVDVSPSEGVLMDYWNEGDLHKHMTTARRKFMPVKEIARYMVQLLRGLAHLHKHKVVHCDVSPQNVFLRRDREREEQLKEEARMEGQDISAVAQTVCYSCALGDFGHSYILSQHEESRSSVAHQGAGFVAPEVKDGRVSTMASDIYSAGKILQELLTLSEGFGEAFQKEPKFIVRKLRNLANLMCSLSPSERPTALKACQKLDTLGEAIN